MSTVDVVVAGAGHNSLVSAAYLAKAGFEVLVLEARPVVGGNTATEELTLPGFLHDSCSTAHNLIQASPAIKELRLAEDYGLEYLHPDPVVHVAFGDGESLTQWRDLDRTCEEFARFSGRDADAYRRLIADYDEAKGAFGAYRNNPYRPRAAPRRGARRARWRRRIAMSAWDVVRTEFEDWHSQAFMLWMAFMTVQPADRPGTGLLAYSLAYGRQQHSWTLPRGGSAALPLALARLIEDHGGTILTGSSVTRPRARGRPLRRRRDRGRRDATARATRRPLDRAREASRRDGAAPRPGARSSSTASSAGARAITLFPTHYATTEAPTFSGRRGHGHAGRLGRRPLGRPPAPAGLDVERGLLADDDPPLLVVCGSVADPSRAPEGQHALKVIGFQPYELADGGAARWDEVKEDAAERNLEQLRRFAPNLTDETILARVVKSPVDLERHERAQLARDLPRRRHGPGAVRRRCASRPRSPIDGPLPDGRHDPPGRLGLAPRRAATPRWCCSRTWARRWRRWSPVPDARVEAAIANWAPRFVSQRRRPERLPAARPRGSRPGTAGSTPGSETADGHRAHRRGGRGGGQRRSPPARRSSPQRVCYHFAKFVWVVDVERNHETTRLASRLPLPGARATSTRRAERVEVPFEDGPLVGNLRRPAGVERPPLVLLLPGLDSTKEEFFLWENVFLDRGMATFSCDGPGQGESGFATHIRAGLRGRRRALRSTRWPRATTSTTTGSAPPASASAGTTRPRAGARAAGESRRRRQRSVQLRGVLGGAPRRSRARRSSTTRARRARRRRARRRSSSTSGP